MKSLPIEPTKLAAHLHVDRRSILRWRKLGVPLHNLAALSEWAARQRQLPARFRIRLMELGGTPTGKSTRKPLAVSDDWKEFRKLEAAKPTGQQPLAALEELRRQRDFVSFKVKRAAEEGDEPRLKFFSDMLVRLEGALHDGELRARRLGIDQGELLPRSEVERIILAMGFWMLRAVDQHLDALTAQLKTLAPELGGEPVRAMLEAELLTTRFVVPFARAAQVRCGVQLPDYVVQKLKTTVGDFIENGEARFDELYATPPEKRAAVK